MADGHVGTKPSDESAVAASIMRQRKRRKWDEPADFFISPGLSIAGAITTGFGSTVGISTPGVLPLSNAIAANTVVPSITQSASSLVQKLCQSKAQDELIAREIVINDAEPTIRYKLTKRQTQEEIQRSSGAVVITRGKFRPPNALPDSEKPLYLHISAGSHLKDMAERITAVDHAASMVEEIIRQGHNIPSTSSSYTAFSNAVQANQPLSTCLFLGFEPDPSQNIAARIRGPNDQYINHIINETGAIVMLKGLGSGNHAISHGEEGMVSHYEDDQQPLHLYLSSVNSKSLEAARNLAENLLDTISAECGASRVSSKVYGAVPPPQQLLLGVTSFTNMGVSVNLVGSSSCGVAGTVQTAQSLVSSTLVGSSVSTVRTQNGNLAKCGTFLPNSRSYALPISTGGTCYSGYGGIYPQATPLQQVALALKQAPASTISVVSSSTSQASTLAKMTPNLNSDTEKRPPQKRKFKELPVVLKELPALSKSSRQESECFNKPGLEDADAGKLSFMPPPKKLNQPAFGKMLPPAPHPPPYSIKIPPPPPKLPSTSDNNSLRERMPPSKSPSSLAAEDAQTTDAAAVQSSWVTEKATTEPISGALLKLVEYEEEEEDIAASAEESCRSNVMRSSSSKPFWAV